MPCCCVDLLLLQNRVALPCAQGSYKAALSNTAGCIRCPVGSTTHGICSTALSDCSVALPGFEITAPGTDAPATPCPVARYSEGYTTAPCRLCVPGLLTPSTGSKSASDCAAPPGYGYYCQATGLPTGAGPVTTEMLEQQQQGSASCVIPCPRGTYRPGWGRGVCLACGVNFTTAYTASVSQEQCFIPAGWGSYSARNGSGLLVAKKCMHGLYGASQTVFGNSRRHPCQVSGVLLHGWSVLKGVCAPSMSQDPLLRG